MAADAPSSAAWQRGRVTSWVFTSDHKAVGRLYLATSAVFLAGAAIMAILLRAQLFSSHGSVLNEGSFAKTGTVYSTTALFLVGVPLLLGLASYVVPLMVGAREMAAPRAHALSYWLVLFGGVVLWGTWPANHGPAKCGLSGDVACAASASGQGQRLWVVALLLVVIGMVVCCGCLLATIGFGRAPGMTWSRLPLYVWSVEVSAAILFLSGIVFAGSLALLFLDLASRASIFDTVAGGGTIAWGQLFWFGTQPLMVAIVLTGLGIVAEVVPVFAGTPLGGRRTVRISLVLAGILGLVTWGQHLYTTDMPTWADVLFTVTSLLLVVPLLVVAGEIVGTLARGSLRLTAASAAAVAALVLLVAGLVAGVLATTAPLAYSLAPSVYEAGYLHLLLGGGGGLAAFAGVLYWYPKMTGRRLDEGLGLAAVGLLGGGAVLAFVPLLLVGNKGIPVGASVTPPGDGLRWLNGTSLLGTAAILAAVGLVLANVVRTRTAGRRVGADPWHGDTLEWLTSSPPPPGNFDRLPEITSDTPVRDLRTRLHGR